VAENKAIQILDAALERVEADLYGHMATIGALAFSPDGNTLASADRAGDLKLWDMPTYQLLLDLSGHSGPVCYIGFSGNGEVMATAGNSRDGRGEVWLWFAPRHVSTNQ
jgi:WD40 repeat protein